MSGMSGDAASLHDLVGSAFFVDLIDRFYDGVEGDQVLMALYPEGSDTVAARDRLAKFFIQYFGGPHDYMEQRGHPMLRMRHSPYVIGPRERDRWLAHMAVAIETMSTEVPEGIRDQVVDQLARYVVNAAEHLRNA